MDEWETFIEGYRESDDPKDFTKVLKSAENIIVKDLASFEIEWFLSTLLQKPVNLLRMVAEKRTSDDWNECVLNSLKLLTNVVTKYENANKYYEEIVSLCLMPHDAKIKQQALTCLTSVVPHSSLAARDLNQHLLALEMATTCKSPLALLIGAICEHHPDVVEAEMTNIWRVFLNFLDINKNSTKVIKSTLEGIMGLFKHFGMELPTMELNVFYDKFVNYIDLPGCEKTVLVLLQRHAALFRERVRRDVRVRRAAWRAGGRGDARAALRAVYGAVADVAGAEEMTNIMATEIEPHTRSHQYIEKFTALYILSDIYKSKGLGDLNPYIDTQELEFDIRSGNINYETCEAISWCVQSNILYSDRLLQTAILFYDKFIALKRNDVIVNTLLQAEKQVRSAAVIFLILETSRSFEQQYIQLWRDLLDNNENTTVLEYAPLVVDDVMEYMLGILEGLGDEEAPPQLSAQLSVLPRVLRSRASAINARRTIGQNVSIQACLDDEDKFQHALALTELSDSSYTDSEVISAIEEFLFNIDIFIEGKYGGRDCNNNNDSDSVLIARLKNKLSLELPYQNTAVKINLKELCHSAIECEDVEACKTLCNIICSSLAIKKDEILQSVLIRVLVCLSHCSVDISYILSAVSMCDAVCANELIEWITREKSSRSIKILLEALEVLLLSDTEGLLLQNVLENIILYEDESKQQALSEIIQKLLQLLKDNNLLCQKYLPDILIKVLKQQNSNLTKTVTDIFIDKIELYDRVALNKTTDNIFRVLNVRNKTADGITKMAVEFVINIFEIKKYNTCLMEYYFSISEEINLSVLVRIKRENELNLDNMKVLNDWLSEIFFRCTDFDDDKAMFDFIAEYADILVDFDKENTYKVISRVIQKLTPEKTLIIHKKLSKCVSSLKNTKNYEPILMKTNFESILKQYPIRNITESIEKYSFETKHEIILNSLNVILNILEDDGSILMEFAHYVRQWLGWIIKLNSSGYIERSLKSKLDYLNDLVAVSLRFFKDEEILDLVYKEDITSGLNFLRTFMSATFKYLIKRPYKLLLAQQQCCLLLNDVVKYAVRRNRGSEVLELVDELWPTFSTISSFDQKYWLLLDLAATSKLPPESNPMHWVVATIKERSLVEKVKLVVLLPPDGEFNIRSVLAPHLPALSELRAVTSCALRALLDALAHAHAHAQDTEHTQTQLSLLDVVAALVEGDDAKGWWDNAIDMCMCTLAPHADMRMLQHVHARSARGRSRGVCERLLIPLLRYTKPSLCEEFLSSILEDLLSTLKMVPRSIVNHYSYEKCVTDYIRSLSIIQIIFEKIPKENIESPRSRLYSKMSATVGDTPFYLISTVCKLCFTLRSKVQCPESAGTILNTCRLFYCVNYNCLSTAILLRDPKPQVYGTVFDVRCWDQLIGDEDIQLPIREQWRQRVTRQAACAPLGELRSRSRSDARSRMFTRTLSENPLAYDLLQEDEQPEPLELQLPDNPLNRHPCSGVLCALLAVQGARGPDVWLSALDQGLRQGRVPVRWLLAQAVVNSRAELSTHASTLHPALLAVLRDTAADGKLNGLHVDILDTLILWREETSENVNSIVECVINTAIHNRHRANVYWTLADKLTKLLDFWRDVRLSWTCFERHFSDLKSDTAKVCLQLLKRITKCNIVIPELLNTLLEALEAKKYILEVYELLGLVLAVDSRRDAFMKRYFKILDRLRNNDKAEYIKMLYYVQKGYPQGCDEHNFRSVIDLTRKMPTREKLKCLEILSTHVQTDNTTDEVASMFDTVGLGENLNCIEGLKLLRNGIHLMEAHSRKYYALQVAESCRLLPEKTRIVAYEILIKALESLLPSETSEPPSKRSAGASNSLILSETDGFTRSLLETVARGVAGEVPGVREGVGGILSKELDVRFCESYNLVMKQTDHPVSPAAILDIFFHVLRDEQLKNTKLRDEPIELSEKISSIISTLRDYLKENENLAECVNVQITLYDTLDSLLKFSERNTDAAVSLLVQLVRSFPAKRPGFDFSCSLGAAVAPTLAAAHWPAAVARAAGADWDGLKQAIENLSKLTRGSEDEDMCKLLEEDYKLRCSGPEQFILGSPFNYDVDMSEAPRKFSVKDLVSAFGALSNWDNLTLQQKRSIKTNLPPLWTTTDNFKTSLEEYNLTDGPVWMKCMLSSEGVSNFKYLRDVDKWPRKLFDISAVAETPILQSIVDGEDKDVYLRADIPPSECLAEWAARILIRSTRLPPRAARPPARAWGELAGGRALHDQVLLCCKAITADTDLYESEVLKWFRLRVLALRAIALERNDTDSLRNTLNLAVTYTPQFIDSSSFGDILGMNEVILKMRRDLKSLNKDHVESAMQDIKYKLQDNNNIYDKKVLESVCTLALTFYDQLWETSEGTSEQNELLLNMSRTLGLIVNLDLGPKKLSTDVIINRLDEFTGEELNDQVAENLLNVLQTVIKNLDTISLEVLKSKIDLFKKYDDHETVRYLRENEGIVKYKMCLNLVGDAGHLLLQYCSQALKVLNDETEWTKIFEELKRNIFENPYAGPDYEVLNKHKNKLYDIAEFDSTDIETKKRVLSSVQSQLKQTRSSVSLSHVCPALCERDIADDSLNKLLCLKPGVSVFKFEEKVPLFVDSIRRPAVLRVRLSDGRARGYIVKRGERARTHCAAVRLLAAVHARSSRTVYNVSISSGGRRCCACACPTAARAATS
ncbi:unnamed protein product [Euphydryas editha]|uniref:DNA-dependent protein kinase catalytic subunit CC3 domain-containing protein n=1 Tax=Euphydryas editha TaxID=104508 RepID=A0AAU9UQS2_EUPED|nr:unnamed protein product [Euphydryas editha]